MTMDTITHEIRHLTRTELDEGLAEIRRSPKDNGRLAGIVIRPAVDERRSLASVEISAEGGVHGDRWARECWKTLPDGRPHPDVQVCIMNARAIALVAQHEDRWPLAGDNLFLDLELSDENLPPGQRLALGSAVLEITAEAHNACGKFAERYGRDAAKFVNSPEGKRIRLRGIYAKVVQSGTIRVGDAATKLA